MLALLLAPQSVDPVVTPPSDYVTPIVYGFYDTKPLDVFMPLIMPHAKGAPLPTAYNALRNAAIEFCERTRLWRWTDEFDVTDLQCEQIDTPTDSVVHEIESVRFNGAKLDPAGAEWLDHEYRNTEWEARYRNGNPQFYTQRELGSIMIAPYATGRVRWDLYLKPHPEARSLPAFMSRDYRQLIAEGALGYLLMTPEQPFSNPDLATFYQLKFNNNMDKLFDKKSKGQQRARIRTKANWF